MTYTQAHNIIHGKAPDDPSIPAPPPLTAGYPVDASTIDALKEDLDILTRLARKLRTDREEVGGAVDLSSGDQGNELKFTLDENNNPIKVTPKKQVEIHHTIAELMILANTWVAKTIHDKMPDRALLRVHRSAEEKRFEDLKEVLKAGKISFDGSSNMALAESLKRAETATKSGSLMSLFQSLATRYVYLGFRWMVYRQIPYFFAAEEPCLRHSTLAQVKLVVRVVYLISGWVCKSIHTLLRQFVATLMWLSTSNCSIRVKIGVRVNLLWHFVRDNCPKE